MYRPEGSFSTKSALGSGGLSLSLEVKPKLATPTARYILDRGTMQKRKEKERAMVLRTEGVKEAAVDRPPREDPSNGMRKRTRKRTPISKMGVGIR